MMMPLTPALDWFGGHGWTPLPSAGDLAPTWPARRACHAATGTGKRLRRVVWPGCSSGWAPTPTVRWPAQPPRLRVLWITRRCAGCRREQALRAPLVDLGLPWTVERRTGDVSSHARAASQEPPTALITTPEPFTPPFPSRRPHLLRRLEAVVVDEMARADGHQARRAGGTPVGAAARLASVPCGRGVSVPRWATWTRRWPCCWARCRGQRAARLPGARRGAGKSVVIDSLLPDRVDRFPWAGHLGLKMLPQVVDAIEEGAPRSSSPTRSQTELWYQALITAAGLGGRHRPASQLAVARHTPVGGRRPQDGYLRCVVCTSSLDLGVDFSPVDRVLQVGSPRAARLFQRAGRSGHQPGVESHCHLCPPPRSNWSRSRPPATPSPPATSRGREPPDKPLDVLVQHLVTVALGGGFVESELLAEVRTAYQLPHTGRRRVAVGARFRRHGGDALHAYPEYKRISLDDGRYVVGDRQIGTFHRLHRYHRRRRQIEVRYLNGPSLGTIVENFVARLSPGDRFALPAASQNWCAREMTAFKVRRANSSRGAVPGLDQANLPIPLSG